MWVSNMFPVLSYELIIARSKMFEGTYAPPFYTDLYNFRDGAQNDIFLDSYADIPPPSPDSTAVPTPIAHPTGIASAASEPSPSATASANAPSISASSSSPIPSAPADGKSRTW